ncbi:MAG: protein translocase subunit SecF [Clostridia bacterium]
MSEKIKLSEKINLVKKLPIFAIISAVFCAIGLISVLLLPFGVNFFNFDIDFAGGTTMQYNMHKTLDKPELDKIAGIVKTASGQEVSSVQKSGDKNEEVIIKTKTLDTATRDKVFQAIKSEYKLNDGTAKDKDGNLIPTDILSVDNVDPVMGADLRNSAILAIVIAIILMLLYITIRFDFKSGLAAVLALAQDILVMISAYVILRIPMNMTFIAAMLTILGYSINATIVVFDRVRENRKMLKKVAFSDIVNTSIWQTMTRSVNTTITVLIMLVMVIIFGVPSISHFALPLTIGVVAGLYSSVFLSGPLWAVFMNLGKKKA